MTAADTGEIDRLREASIWLSRLRTEPDCEDTIRDWLRWCEADPANAEAFQQIRQLWNQFDQIEPIPLAKAAVASSWASDAARIVRMLMKSRLLWLASGTALCVLTALVLAYHPRAASSLSSEMIAVSQPLPDGSVVELQMPTHIGVVYQATARRLEMSAGEAHFRVRPNRDRPFIVRAGSIEVTAVGTAFDVKRDTDGIVVTVSEGVVTVGPARDSGGWAAAAPWRVSAGGRFEYSDREGSVSLSSGDAIQRIAWGESRLEYVNTPLSRVVADISQYSRYPIEIADAATGRMTFTGTVFTNAVEPWLDGLPGALPVLVDRKQPGVTLLRPRPTHP